MACSVEEVNVGLGVLCFISYAKFSKILEVPWDSHRFFGSRNSPTISILHIIRHVYRSVWPAREAEPRFGAALDRSAHDCKTRLLVCCCEQSQRLLMRLCFQVDQQSDSILSSSTFSYIPWFLSRLTVNTVISFAL